VTDLLRKLTLNLDQLMRARQYDIIDVLGPTGSECQFNPRRSSSGSIEGSAPRNILKVSMAS
jgi:hypothetical protein